MQFPYSGRYINLERSIERRERLERQLRELQLTGNYLRFNGVDGTMVGTKRGVLTAGEYGCFASHAQLVSEEATPGRAHLHVLEDDAVLSTETVPAIKMAISAGFLDQYDLLFTDIFVPPFVSMIAAFDKARRENTIVDFVTGKESVSRISVLDLRNTSWACTSSYLVAGRSLGKVAQLLSEMLAKGPAKAIDLTLRDIVNAGLLKAGCMLPFVTSIDLALAADSTIRAGGDVNRLAHNVLREALSVNPDWDSVDAILKKYFPAAINDPRREAIGRVLDFVMFGKSRKF
jgi:hypothetical protein